MHTHTPTPTHHCITLSIGVYYLIRVCVGSKSFSIYASMAYTVELPFDRLSVAT